MQVNSEEMHETANKLSFSCIDSLTFDLISDIIGYNFIQNTMLILTYLN